MAFNIYHIIKSNLKNYLNYIQLRITLKKSGVLSVRRSVRSGEPRESRASPSGKPSLMPSEIYSEKPAASVCHLRRPAEDPTPTQPHF